MKYRLFTTPQCKGCGPVKEYLKQRLAGEEIDASTEDGAQLALDNNILSAPTVIFTDEQGNEVGRANNLADVRNILTG